MPENVEPEFIALWEAAVMVLEDNARCSQEKLNAAAERDRDG